MNLSVKVSALTPLLRPDAPDLGTLDAAERLRPLLRAARDAGAHLHIDMESMDSREAVTTGVKILVVESPDEITALVRAWRADIARDALGPRALRSV